MHLEPEGESLSHRETLGKGYWSWERLSKRCFGVLRREGLGLHSLKTLDATSVLEWEEYSRLPLEVVSSVSLLRSPVIDMPIRQAFPFILLVSAMGYRIISFRIKRRNCPFKKSCARGMRACFF